MIALFGPEVRSKWPSEPSWRMQFRVRAGHIQAFLFPFSFTKSRSQIAEPLTGHCPRDWWKCDIDREKLSRNSFKRLPEFLVQSYRPISMLRFIVNSALIHRRYALLIICLTLCLISEVRVIVLVMTNQDQYRASLTWKWFPAFREDSNTVSCTNLQLNRLPITPTPLLVSYIMGEVRLKKGTEICESENFITTNFVSDVLTIKL